MSFDLTRQSLFKTFLYFVLLATVFWGAEFIDPGHREWITAETAEVAAPLSAGMPLAQWIDGWLIRLPTLGIILSFLLVFVNAFLVTRVVIRNVIYLERTYMPSIIYLLISSGYYNSDLSFRPLLVALLMLIAAEMVIRSYSSKSLVAGSYLVIGFVFGTAAAVYAPALFLVLMIPIGLLIFRLFNPREWLAALGGWAMPILFSAYGVWLTGGEFWGFIPASMAALSTSVALPSYAHFSSFEWTFTGCVFILFLLSMITFLGRRRTHKLRPFKAYLYFVWMLLIWIAVMLLAPCRSFYQLPILALPLAVIIPAYFNSRRPNFISNFLYALMIGCAVVIHLLPFFL